MAQGRGLRCCSEDRQGPSLLSSLVVVVVVDGPSRPSGFGQKARALQRAGVDRTLEVLMYNTVPVFPCLS